MEKAWLTPLELLGITGLPKSRQGLNKRAREEGWEKRKRKGVQGRAVEYARESLLQEVRKRLQIREMAEMSPPAYTIRRLPNRCWLPGFRYLKNSRSTSRKR